MLSIGTKINWIIEFELQVSATVDTDTHITVIIMSDSACRHSVVGNFREVFVLNLAKKKFNPCAPRMMIINLNPANTKCRAVMY